MDDRREPGLRLRRPRRITAVAALLLAAGWAGCAPSGGSGDATPPTGPRPPFRTAATRAEASRFLARATFGADDASVDELTQLGFDGWVDRQMQLQASLKLPDASAARPEERLLRLYELWWQHAVGADDQLRQRVAFALSEILVVSLNGDRLEEQPLLVADYYDTLARGAFGDFRTLLEEVTLHPAMGIFLSMVKSRAPVPGESHRPDENYAREVMQLFTIGLAELNQDGTPRLEATGEPIPTYDQAVVVGMAHALTGWNFSGTTSDELEAWLESIPSPGPLIPFERYHDHGFKTLVGGAVGPAGRTAREDLALALDLLAAHPNVGPFLGKQLIQKLVTSNPSPAYVARVAGTWADDGTGRRGNLGAVVRAILLDDEALRPENETSTTFGKLREPVLRYVALLRLLANGGGGLPRRGEGFAIDVRDAFGQQPITAPSVFNFFRPDHDNADLRARELVAPELQIMTHALASRATNKVGADLLLRGDTLPIDTATLGERARDPAGLVDWIADTLAGGELSEADRDVIVEYVANVPFEPGAPDPANNDVQPPYDMPGVRRALEAIHLVAISPAFAVQR